MLKNKIRGALLAFVGAVAGYCGSLYIPDISIIEEEIKQSTHTNVEVWKAEAKQAFVKAEEEVLKPEPDPDITPVPEPNPDAKKCPCKGSGWITHGDGHKTPCPYHSEKEEEKKYRCKCDTSRTYCNCVKAYGKCGCQKTEITSKEKSGSCGPEG